MKMQGLIVTWSHQ